MDGNISKSRKFDPQSSFIGGISDDDKKLLPYSYAHGRSVDIHSHSREVKLLPRTSKESGSVIVDLPKWADRVGDTIYIYGDDGNVYTRSLAGSHTKVRQVSDSSGNGLKFYGEDNFLYYTSDKVIGRYGPTNGTAAFTDDFLGSEGGIPLNTYSLDLEASSSQYAARADTASLSITSDLCIEAYCKMESLPTVGNTMTIASKWDESGVLRSYMFDIYAISGYFGDGSDGALTVSVNQTETVIDSACTGTSGTTSLSATNASFTAGQVLLIHQSQGTGAGTWQRNKIVSYTAGTITLESELNASYTSGAQVRVLKQYSSVTVNSGITWTAKAWNGTVGGILAFLCSGTITVTGTINANGGNGSAVTTNNTGGGTGGGFRGGQARYTASTSDTGYQAEGTAGAGGAQSNAANGNGGGGAIYTTSGNPAAGGSGGNGAAGSAGGAAPGATSGTGGSTSGSADLTTMTFGGGGAGGAGDTGLITSVGGGGSGGGIVFLTGTTITISGAITANGGAGANGHVQADGAGGGGGSILLKAQTATLGSSLVTASGGAASEYGAAGGTGRVHLDYYTSYTGTTTPTLDYSQDNTLVTTTSYQLRLSISADGTNPERLTKTVDITTATWYRFAVSWDASASTATFYIDAVSQGSSTGALTAIHNNTSDFHVGAMENSGGSKANFLDGLIDDVRIWNTERTQSQLFLYKDVQVVTTSSGLAAYYKFNNNYTDSTANANDLTSSGSPVFSATVPFLSPTTRLDLDQELNTSGNTYTVPVAITESSTTQQDFIPTRDPQKSVEVLMAAKGTGDWTVTVHDPNHRVVASKTVTNANLPAAGDYEFVFSSVWRPILGQTYHFHLTSTVADGTVTTTTASDLNTVDFHTYFQFLVEDAYHPIIDQINLLVIGNERYVATWNGGTYNPHRLTLPAGYRVRCFAKFGKYLAIGCTRGTNIYSYDQGVIFFWDGISVTYEDYIDVPEGAINAMLGSQGTLYIAAGYQGDILEYTGGSKARKLKRIPNVGADKYIEIMPGAMSMWKALLRIGAGVTDSSDVYQGVYTHGHMDEDDPIALSFDFPISTGNTQDSTIQIGLLFPVEKKLLIGWKNNTSYGVDVVDPAGSPFTTGTIERLVQDYGAVYKEKTVMVLRADMEPLNSGETVRLKYRKDSTEGWTYGDTVSTTDAEIARLPIEKGRHKELQVGVDLGTSTTTSPVLLELSFEEEVLSSESRF